MVENVIHSEEIFDLKNNMKKIKSNRLKQQMNADFNDFSQKFFLQYFVTKILILIHNVANVEVS